MLRLKACQRCKGDMSLDNVEHELMCLQCGNVVYLPLPCPICGSVGLNCDGICDNGHSVLQWYDTHLAVAEAIQALRPHEPIDEELADKLMYERFDSTNE